MFISMGALKTRKDAEWCNALTGIPTDTIMAILKDSQGVKFFFVQDLLQIFFVCRCKKNQKMNDGWSM